MLELSMEAGEPGLSGDGSTNVQLEDGMEGLASGPKYLFTSLQASLAGRARTGPWHPGPWTTRPENTPLQGLCCGSRTAKVAK